ncbi:MAG TPA: iron-containing alcohol dehydrogenase [Gemmatimonas sp.]|nr:iron-containing alcohol dehydrogenase [Gemmatimonas sp.]
MTGFDFACVPRMISGDGQTLRLAEQLARLGVARPFVVTDRGLMDAGVLTEPLRSLVDAGLAPVVWADVQADPPEGSIIAAIAAARAAGADGVIGLGGGSSLDTAKLVALLARTGQPLAEIYGIGLAHGPRLPLVQVPTTAGTGSEVTPIAIVTTAGDEKKGVVSPHLYADVAILDATLTVGLPPRVTAMTGVDAMVHAIEAYTSRRLKNVMSDALAHGALALLSANIRAVIADGGNLAARRAMLEGSTLAGMAFANAPVAAVHALAYPLGGRFHVPHGLSNALVLIPVLEFNAPLAGALYAELAHDLPADCMAGGDRSARGFIDAMAALVHSMPFEQRLRDVGVSEADLPMLATDAMAVQRLLVNNPRDVSYDDVLALYRAAL